MERGDETEQTERSLILEAGSEKKTKKLTVCRATFLIMSEMMGAAVLSLPRAVVTSDWIGLVIILFIGLITLYAGVLIGRCRTIIDERWPEVNTHLNDPYAAIAEKAFGKFMREFVRFNVLAALFSFVVVLLLLMAEMTSNIDTVTGISYCNWIIIFGFLLIIPSLLGSPKDFWQAGIFSVVSSLIPLFIIAGCMIGGVMKDLKSDPGGRPNITFWNLALAYSTVMFVTGATPSFPTIQNDMKVKQKFTKALVIAYTVVITIYLFIGIVSYTTLTSGVDTDIMKNMPDHWITDVATFVLISHTVAAIFIMMNPVYQEFEKLCRVPLAFGWKRVLARSFIMMLALLSALTIPKFNFILNIIGASSVSLLSFVFPSMFYLKLSSLEPVNGSMGPERRSSLFEKVVASFIIIVGILCGIVSTYTSIVVMTSAETYVPPCY